MKKTALYDEHIKANAKIINFFNWSMPINYGSQLKEHNYVRNDAGMFDVSHMSIVDLKGRVSYDFLRYLLANDIAKINKNKSLYSVMLNASGGIIDDLIIYCIADNHYRMVINAACSEKDLNWINTNAKDFQVDIDPLNDYAIIAVQGPNAVDKTIKAAPKLKAAKNLTKFSNIIIDDIFIARIGYTGEDGFEIMLKNNPALSLWKQLLKVGIKPCGLGARDTLRLEAGFNLYGNEMNEQTTPLETNLIWSVDFKDNNRKFIGKESLKKQLKLGVKNQLKGMILTTKGVLRNNQEVFTNKGIGKVTSGSFSPTLNKAIAFVSVPTAADSAVEVKLRAEKVKAKLIKMPFYKNGKILTNN